MTETISNKWDLERYHERLEIEYSNPSTRNQYKVMSKTFYYVISNYLNQASVDKFFRLRANNTINRAFIKSICECFEVSGIKIPKIRSRPEEKELKFLEYDQIQTIIATGNKRIKATVSFLFDTGMRIAEIMGVTMNDIDLDKLEVKAIGKGRKHFTEYFSKKTKGYYLEYIKDLPLEYPFRYPKDLKHHGKKFLKELKEHCSKLRMDNVTPHRIRHSLGHHLTADKGWDLIAIKEKLRHKGVSTTQIYAVISKEQIRDKMRKEVFEDE